MHTLISLCNNGPQRAFDTYSPTIVSGFGFPKLTSNAMASVGLWLQVPVSFAFSYVSDRLYVLSLLSLLLLLLPPTSLTT